MAKRSRKTYSDELRNKIIETAQSENLSALEVQKRFGVTPVTYYSWRKKLGLKGKRGRKPSAGRAPVKSNYSSPVKSSHSSSDDLGAQVRAGVQAKVRELLPSIVRDEVSRYLDTLLGAAPVARRRGRPPGSKNKKK